MTHNQICIQNTVKDTNHNDNISIIKALKTILVSIQYQPNNVIDYLIVFNTRLLYYTSGDSRENLLKLEISRERIQIKVLEAHKSNLAVEKPNLFLKQHLLTEQLKAHNIVVEVY